MNDQRRLRGSSSLIDTHSRKLACKAFLYRRTPPKLPPMGKVYEEVSVALEQFLMAQRVFFVATAPSREEGHLNVSPKGMGDFRMLGPKRAAYLDYPGSGVETLAHLRDNGRIVLMFCAF